MYSCICSGEGCASFVKRSRRIRMRYSSIGISNQNRFVTQQHHPAFEYSVVDQLQIQLPRKSPERWRTFTDGYGVNHKLVFVNQPRFGKLGNDAAAAENSHDFAWYGF